MQSSKHEDANTEYDIINDIFKAEQKAVLHVAESAPSAPRRSHELQRINNSIDNEHEGPNQHPHQLHYRQWRSPLDV